MGAWAARGAVAVLLLLPAAAWGATPTSEVPASPQRPSRSVNTKTTLKAYVTLEAGIELDTNRQFAMPLNFRFGLSKRWEAFLGFSPLIGAQAGGETDISIGDTIVGAKVRVFHSDEGDAALDGFVKFGTASEDKGLGTGDTDAGFRFIASRVWGKNHIDFNLGGEFAGVPEAKSNDARWTTVFTWTRTSHERIHYFGELFIQFLPAADFETITTDWGFRYYINRSFVFDTAVYIGLSDNAPDWQLLFGFTKVLGRFGGRRGASTTARLALLP